MIKHTLFVCTTCASKWQDGKKIGESGGEKLFEEISCLYEDWELEAEFHIQAIQCMSACNRPCAVSFAATDKYTYVFGDLSSEDTAQAILECAGQYHAKSDGILSWKERPEALRKGIIARIPPLV
ncbi:MAG: DUF1636 domain-containing protein [Cyanobacteria bacterium P01_A01_bin.84]